MREKRHHSIGTVWLSNDLRDTECKTIRAVTTCHQLTKLNIINQEKKIFFTNDHWTRQRQIYWTDVMKFIGCVVIVVVCALIQLQNESYTTKKFPAGSVSSPTFPSFVLLSSEYSQGAVLILFVLLCMDSITSCVAAVSLCIQLTDQRRQTASAYTPVHSKNKHSRGWAM